MLLLARAAAHCCLLLLLRSQGNKANNYRVAQLGICIAVLYMYNCTYVHVVRGYTFMPPPSQPTALLAEVRAPICHIAKKEWLSQVPTALHWGVKRLTTLLRVPLPPPPSTRRLTYSTPMLKGEKRGAAWLGRACGGSEEMRNVGVFIFVERGLFTFLDPYRIHC